VTTVSTFGDWLGNQQILFSLVVSILVLAVIWRIGHIVGRLTDASEESIGDIRSFRVVATVTAVVGILFWNLNQPIPEWLEEFYGLAGGPAIAAWFSRFLPAFVIEEYRAILVTALGAWWVWKMRKQGDEILERFVARRYDEALAPIIENVWDMIHRALDRENIGIPYPQRKVSVEGTELQPDQQTGSR